MADGSLIFDTTIGTGGFKKGIEDIGKEANKGLTAAGNTISARSMTLATAIGSGIGNIIGNLAGNAVNEVTAFFKESIGVASKLSEVQNVVNTTFGDGAAQINAWASAAKDAYGMSELKAKQYTSTLGAMLKSMGLTSKQTISMSENIAGLTGDMASFYNLDYDTAFEKLRAGLSGETEPLKQLGINMSTANLEAYALSKGITKSYDSMSQAEQTTLRYNYLMQATADAQGDFAKTSDGYANQQRILDTTLQELSATVGETLLPIALEATKALNELVTGAKSVVGWVANIFNPPKNELEQEIDDALSAVDQFNASVEKAGGNLNTSLESVKATKALADSLLGSYDRILSKNVLTEEDTAQLKSIASQLVTLYPSLGSALDTTTGLFDDNTTAIRNNITEMAEKQKADAYYIAMQQYSTALLSATVTQATAFKTYGDAYTEWQNKLSNLKALQGLQDALSSNINNVAQFAGQLKTINPLFGRYFDALDDGTYVLNDLGHSAITSSEFMAVFNSTLDRVATEEANASEKAAKLGNAYDTTTKSVITANEQQEIAKDSYAALSKQLGYTSTATDTQTAANQGLTGSTEDNADALEKQKAALEALKAQIASVTAETLKSIDASVGGFDKMGKVRAQSAKSTLAALKSQADYLAKYQENYETAQKKGVSAEVLSQLNDGSKESAEVLAGLTKASESQVKDINAAYASITQQKTDLSTTLAADQVKLDAARQKLQTATDTSGKQVQKTATNTSADIARAKGEAAANAQNIEQAASAASAGKTSVETSRAEAKTAADGMVTDVVGAVDTGKPALANAGSAMIGAVSAGINGNDSARTALIAKVRSALAGANSAASSGGYSVGRYIAQGIASGIDANSSAIQSAVVQAVQSALAAAKRAAGINSPSRLFRDEVGRYLAEGIGVGFTDTMEGVNADMANSLTANVDTLRGLRERSVWPVLANNAAVESEPVTAGAINQYITFSDPMQAPDEIARRLYREARAGLAGARR